jgi:hypothetical protein
MAKSQKQDAARCPASTGCSAGARVKISRSGFASCGPLYNCGVNVSWPCAPRDCRKMRLGQVAFPPLPTGRLPPLWSHAAQSTAKCHPLEHPPDGPDARGERSDRAADLEATRFAASPLVDLQSQPRSAVRPETRRRGRLYLNPPDKALVFSVDEKSQIQALEGCR